MKIIIKADKEMTIKKCEEQAPSIAKVAESPGWPKLWDHTWMESSAGCEDAEQGHLCDADAENPLKRGNPTRPHSH